jgi:hypothetical protein
MGTSAKVGSQTQQKCMSLHKSINRSAIHAWQNCGMSGESVAAASARRNCGVHLENARNSLGFPTAG